MEGIEIFENTLQYFAMGFVSGVFFAYIAKIIHTIWVATQKFF